MRVPLSWLRQYVEIDDIPVETLAERITLAGLEVAAIEYLGVEGPPGSEHLVWDPERVVVGEIVAVDPHPNADRLLLATVEYGAAEPRTVVTGAPNVAAGMKVAYATTGATVLNGYSETREPITLEPRTLRGVASEGMVLSERELGLSDLHEGILELPAESEVGRPLQQVLGDVVIEIDLTPNLGRAASIVGVAREVAALFDRPLRMPDLALEGEGPPVAEAARIDIRVPDVNPRFTLTLIRDVTIAPSPPWMQRRLRLVGMRPINNVVDVTNYVMMELGQPLHAFDYDALLTRARGVGDEVPTIITRLAEKGERLTTLDDIERALDPEDILVLDSAGIVSIAGVMGGAETEVSETTTNVLLEAASWDFISTRKSANRHQLFSEAAYRFSRGVHPAMAARGNARGATLIAELGEGELAAGMVDAYPSPPPPVTVELDPAEVTRLLGIKLPVEQITDYLARLEFEVESRDGQLLVTVPDHRVDVGIPADLVEEVARLYGLDRLPSTLMADALPPLREDRALRIEERVRDLLVSVGLTEIVSYAMTSPEREAQLVPQPEGPKDATSDGYVGIANPSSHERRVMRRSVLGSLLDALQHNLRHRDRVAIFEMGRIYRPRRGAKLPDELGRVVIAMSGPAGRDSWLGEPERALDFFDVKGVVERLLGSLYLGARARFVESDHPSLQPGRAAGVIIDDRDLGVLGELHPIVREQNDLPAQRVAVAELDLDLLVELAGDAAQLRPVPRFPAVVQDLAVVVADELPAADIAAAIREAGGDTLESATLFDLYRGDPIPEGQKSLAFSLRYRDPEKTLTDEEVAPVHARIASALRKRFDARIRGEDA